MINMLLKKLREYPEIFNFFQYGFVGLLGTIVHTGVLALSVEYLKIIPVLATVIGFVFSLVLSYVLNSKWTFKRNSKTKNSFIKYTITCSIGLLLNIIIMFVIVNILEYSYLFGQLTAIVLVPIFNYSLSRYWVFNKVDIKADK